MRPAIAPPGAPGPPARRRGPGAGRTAPSRTDVVAAPHRSTPSTRASPSGPPSPRSRASRSTSCVRCKAHPSRARALAVDSQASFAGHPATSGGRNGTWPRPSSVPSVAVSGTTPSARHAPTSQIDGRAHERGAGGLRPEVGVQEHAPDEGRHVEVLGEGRRQLVHHGVAGGGRASQATPEPGHHVRGAGRVARWRPPRPRRGRGRPCGPAPPWRRRRDGPDRAPRPAGWGRSASR